MSFYEHHHVVPGNGASPIAQYVAVKINPANNSQFITAASSADVAFGLTIATVASAGAECAVVFAGVAKAIAAASLGAGAPVGVASPNGQLGPMAALGVASPVQAPRNIIGYALENAAAGAVFAVAISRGEII